MKVDYEFVNKGKPIISIRLDEELFFASSSTKITTRYLNFDALSGELLTADAIFSPIDEFIAMSEKKFKEKYNLPETISLGASGFWFKDNSFHLPKNIGITDSTVVLHYNPFEIASRAEGPIEIKLQKEEVLNFFKPVEY